jgi:hypothetical protein
MLMSEREIMRRSEIEASRPSAVQYPVKIEKGMPFHAIPHDVPIQPIGDSKGAETALRAALALREKIARDNTDDPEAAAAWLSDESEIPGMICGASYLDFGEPIKENKDWKSI